jgi:tetraacyldisaccharide 4'-kinase
VKSLRILLLPFSFLYWLSTTVRNWFFDIGILRVTRVNVPVVSVGNISAGGTGKTPFVEVIVRKLQSRGRKPAVVSRGYGRRTRGYLQVSGGGKSIASVMDAGDEPVQLADRLRDTIIAVDENRVRAAKRVLAESPADCIVLDDGFQHRYLHRDLNIVLLTAKELVGSQWLLPAGNRRESIASLRRAYAVVISKCNDAREYEIAKTRLSSMAANRIAAFRLVPLSLRNVSTGESIDRRAGLRVPVMIFSGLGDPQSFRRSVEDFGCVVGNSVVFPDHHWYSKTDLSKLRKEFAEGKAELMVTTQKDLVRLRSLEKESEVFFKEVPVFVLEVTPEFIAGEEVIDKLIERVTQ